MLGPGQVSCSVQGGDRLLLAANLSGGTPFQEEGVGIGSPSGADCCSAAPHMDACRPWGRALQATRRRRAWEDTHTVRRLSAGMPTASTSRPSYSCTPPPVTTHQGGVRTRPRLHRRLSALPHSRTYCGLFDQHCCCHTLGRVHPA